METNETHEHEWLEKTLADESSIDFSHDQVNGLAFIIELLTERHLDINGGYPHDWDVIGNELVIADLNDSKERAQTELCRYQLTELMEWVNRAVSYRSLYPDADELESYEETEGE